MTHTILYYGNFLRNFRTLEPTTSTCVNKTGEIGEVEKATAKVDGLQFRYMELPDKEFVAVGVGDIVLRAPVLLVQERHTDGKGFFSGPHFGDDSAMRLIVDMIVANPEYRDALGRLLRCLDE